MNARNMLGLLLGFFSILANAATSSTTTTWQLPAGYYTPAKMPMTLVFPRPDSETNTWARQRIAYADGVMQYRIPISIQGGSYPFHYQLVSGPSGMAIGQDYGDANYGIVTWTPAASVTQGTSYPVDVKVTDQDGNSVDATWTVKVNNNAFIFIDPNSATNGTNGNGAPGSKTNPFNTMQGIAVANGSSTPSTYAGKALIFRGGTTPLYGYTADSYQLNSTIQNPAVFLGYTGDIANGNYPIIDMSSGAFKNWGQPDVYFGELHLINADRNGIGVSGETDTLMYYDWPQGNSDRLTFFENTFNNLPWYSGAGAGSNQAAIALWATSPYRKYVTITGNTIDNFSTALTVMFTTQYAVIENNSILGGGSSQQGVFYLKNDLANLTLRDNTSLTHSYIIQIRDEVDNTNPGFNNIEICYNTFLDPNYSYSSNNGEKLVVYGMGSNTVNSFRYVYRNTLYGTLVGYDFNPYTTYVENNVYIYPYSISQITSTSNINLYLGSGINKVVYASDITKGSATGNLYGSPSGNYIDQNGALTGTFASQYRGKVGAEIGSGYTPLSAPNWQ